MKTIFRPDFKGHFVCLPNDMLRDNRMSLRARGLLAMILTHSDEWVITKEWLLGQVPEGKTAMASMFRELEAFGYAVMIENREHGKIVSKVWTFYAVPVPQEQRSSFSQIRTLPPTEKPDTGKATSGESAPKNTMGVPEKPCSENQPDEISPAAQVLNHLNEVSGKRFTHVESHLKLIRRRLAEVNDDVDGVKLMVSRWSAKWKDDPVMREYLSPPTLFGPEKFMAKYDARNDPLPMLTFQPRQKTPEEQMAEAGYLSR